MTLYRGVCAKKGGREGGRGERKREREKKDKKQKEQFSWTEDLRRSYYTYMRHRYMCTCTLKLLLIFLSH